jgi:hypothetical protein
MRTDTNLSIGSGKECDIKINDLSVQTRHAELIK